MSIKKYLNIQAELDMLDPLYIQEHKENWLFEKTGMEEFILLFLTNMAQQYSVFNAKTKLKECKASRRRSISDIYRLCKYYYNDVTLLEVQWILAKLHKEKKVGYFYCNSIKKRVYMSLEYYKTHTVNPVQYGSPDEYDITPESITKLSNTNFDDL